MDRAEAKEILGGLLTRALIDRNDAERVITKRTAAGRKVGGADHKMLKRYRAHVEALTLAIGVL